MALYVLLAVAGLRPLIPEAYDLAGTELTSSLAAVADPLPVVTLFMDAVILLGALAWALASGRRFVPRYRWTGLEPGFLLVLIGMAASCAAASNRRVAINASADWACMVILALALAQVLRDAHRVRLALCVLAASAAAQAYQCFEQVLVSFEETEQMYREHREELWGRQGVPLDSQRVEMFERRLQAREASGYLSHSNIAAAHLLLGFFVTLALSWPSLAKRSEPAAWVSIAAGLLVSGVVLAAMLLTHSFGAALACAAGLVAALLAWRYRAWAAPHRRLALALGWSLVLGGVLAVLSYGQKHGRLPGQSLSFRWGYWTASVQLIEDHLWTGVGRENFGDAYLQYKSIAWPEEVKNPHNLLVAAAAEWGLPGLVGVVSMLVGGSMAVTRRAPEILESPIDTDGAATRRRNRLGWMALLAVGIFGPRWFLLGSDDVNYLYVATVLPAIAWLIAFTVAARTPTGKLDSALLLLNAGLFAFLLQESINFAIIVPGSATTFFALLGISIGARQPPAAAPVAPAGGHTTRHWIPTVVAGLILLMLASRIIPPVWSAGRLLTAARRAPAFEGSEPLESQSADRLYRQARAADLLDPAPAADHAEWLRREAPAAAEPRPLLLAAMGALDEAIARNPLNAAMHSRRAMTALALARLTGDSGHARAAVESARRAVSLYPTRPLGYVDLATCLRYAGESEGRTDWMRDALEAYRYAITLDDQRPAWETIRRLRRWQVSEIQANIAAVEEWLDAHASRSHSPGGT